jgi:hypothetical protein
MRADDEGQTPPRTVTVKVRKLAGPPKLFMPRFTSNPATKYQEMLIKYTILIYPFFFILIEY